MVGAELFINRVRAPIDKIVTLVGGFPPIGYHSETIELPPQFGDLNIEIHYRPTGAIGHIKERKTGKFVHRLTANSGKELRESLNIDPV